MVLRGVIEPEPIYELTSVIIFSYNNKLFYQRYYIVEFLGFSFLVWLVLALIGFPFAYILLPLQLRKYAFVMSTIFGYSYVVSASNLVYGFDFKGTDQYGPYLLIVPFLLIILLMFTRGKLIWQDFVDGKSLNALLGGAVGIRIIFLAIPILLAANGAAVSVSMGNLDVMAHAQVSRFLQEFKLHGQEGDLLLFDYKDYAINAWFGVYQIVAFLSTILQTHPHKITTLTISLISAQGVVFFYLLLKDVLNFSVFSSWALTLLFIISPVMSYVSWDAFTAQAVAYVLCLGMIFFHLYGISKPMGKGGYIGIVLPNVALGLGILCSYHYLFFITVALLFFHTFVYSVFSRQYSQGCKVVGWIILTVALASAIAFNRASGFTNWIIGMKDATNGWFIPWLSPMQLVGANTYETLRNNFQIDNLFFKGVRLIVGSALCITSFVVAWRWNSIKYKAFLLGLVIPVSLLGFALAIKGSENGIWGSYKSFKITASYLPLTMAAMFLFAARAGTGSSSKITNTVFTILICVLAISSIRGDVGLAWSIQRHAFAETAGLEDLQKIEQFEDVDFIQIPQLDYPTVMWAKYFLMRKPQRFIEFPYGGSKGKNNEWDIEGYTLLQRFNTETERIPQTIVVEGNKSIVLHKINDNFDVVRFNKDSLSVSLGEGWWTKQPFFQWTGSAGNKCAFTISSPSGNNEVYLDASLVSILPLGESKPSYTEEDVQKALSALTLKVNGEKVPLESKGTLDSFKSAPFALQAGQNKVIIETKFQPQKPVTNDKRSLLLAWKQIRIVVIDRQS